MSKTRRPYKSGNVDEQGNYIVGAHRPPVEHRFEAGRSGNPRGRPKGARGIKTILREQLNKKQAIKVNGKEQIATRRENIYETLTLRAGAGDLKAQAKVIDLELQLFGPDGEDARRNTLSANDQAILDAWLQDLERTGAVPEDGGANESGLSRDEDEGGTDGLGQTGDDPDAGDGWGQDEEDDDGDTSD